MRFRLKTGIGLLFGIMLVGLTGFHTPAQADWSLQLPILLNGASFSPMPLAFGLKTGATDGFDQGIDHIGPLPAPGGENAFLATISGESAPYDHLLKDFRGTLKGITLWRLVLNISPGSVMTVQWDRNALPSGWSLTYQEADSNWTGVGGIYGFIGGSQFEVPNQSGDVITKRIIITATPL
jgi:hypothetical protein